MISPRRSEVMAVAWSTGARFARRLASEDTSAGPAAGAASAPMERESRPMPDQKENLMIAMGNCGLWLDGCS